MIYDSVMDTVRENRKKNIKTHFDLMAAIAQFVCVCVCAEAGASGDLLCLYGAVIIKYTSSFGPESYFS